jgi:hypothetical protein
MKATDAGEALPRWARRVFWSVVAIEWTLALALSAVFVGAIVATVLAFTCVPDSTVYSAGFSGQAWDAIRPGDEKASVKARLGEPLQTWSSADDELWSYSKPAPEGGGDYRERKLRFSLRGRVLEKVEACYID